MTDIIVGAKGLTKSYEQGGSTITILSDVDLTIARGERVALLGASGSGKTTLLQMLAALDQPTAGEVIIHGRLLSGLTESARVQLRRDYLGFVFQFHHLLAEFTVLENVTIPLKIAGLSKKKADEKAQFYLNAVGLAQKAHQSVATLSGGERQRVAIARALVTEPKCVLADEPTGNLDQVTAHTIAELIDRLAAEFETSFFVVTHNLTLAERMDRILILENGQLQPHPKQSH